MHEWVVTYRLESCTGNWGVVEFFRGSEQECRRISRQFAGGESDTVCTHDWEVLVGPVAEWEQFLSSAETHEL